jgi:5-methylcytosine-specific restriction endonuclease McrA
MSAPENLSKVDRLRARDGDLCWLCAKHLNFKAKPNSPQAWSVEHLLPISRGGPSTLENLVLCHPPCNRMLKDRPLKDKIKLRERRQRKIWAATRNAQASTKA